MPSLKKKQKSSLRFRGNPWSRSKILPPSIFSPRLERAGFNRSTNGIFWNKCEGRTAKGFSLRDGLPVEFRLRLDDTGARAGAALFGRRLARGGRRRSLDGPAGVQRAGSAVY